jgi:hypothetical protein
MVHTYMSMFDLRKFIIFVKTVGMDFILCWCIIEALYEIHYGTLSRREKDHTCLRHTESLQHRGSFWSVYFFNKKVIYCLIFFSMYDLRMFFYPYRTFPQEISGSGFAPTTHQTCLLFYSALYIFSSYEKVDSNPILHFKKGKNK